MKRIILVLAWATIATGSAMAQEYDAHDLGKLKAFLIQPSATSGKSNGEQLGLNASEVASLNASDEWVSKISGLAWTEAIPKRISEVSWTQVNIAGDLDMSGLESLKWAFFQYNQLSSMNLRGCTALTISWAFNNHLTSADISGCELLTNLDCHVNELTTLDVTGCVSLENLHCYNNQLTTLDLRHSTSLRELWCRDNPLLDMTLGCLTPPPLTNGATDNLSVIFYLEIPFDLSNATLYVPKGTAALYRAADAWKRFGNIVESGSVSTAFLPSPLVSVFSVGTTLSVLTPNNETVTVYSSSGSLLFRSSKLPGHATFNISHLPKGVIIVKGSTGWRRKIFR
jgi:hypothetical protein